MLTDGLPGEITPATTKYWYYLQEVYHRLYLLAPFLLHASRWSMLEWAFFIAILAYYTEKGEPAMVVLKLSVMQSRTRGQKITNDNQRDRRI